MGSGNAAAAGGNCSDGAAATGGTVGNGGGANCPGAPKATSAASAPINSVRPNGRAKPARFAHLISRGWSCNIARQTPGAAQVSFSNIEPTQSPSARQTAPKMNVRFT